METIGSKVFQTVLVRLPRPSVQIADQLRNLYRVSPLDAEQANLLVGFPIRIGINLDESPNLPRRNHFRWEISVSKYSDAISLLIARPIGGRGGSHEVSIHYRPLYFYKTPRARLGTSQSLTRAVNIHSVASERAHAPCPPRCA